MITAEESVEPVICLTINKLTAVKDVVPIPNEPEKYELPVGKMANLSILLLAKLNEPSTLINKCDLTASVES